MMVTQPYTHGLPGCLGRGHAYKNLFSNVDYLVFETCCLVKVGFTDAVFGLDLSCCSVVVDGLWC